MLRSAYLASLFPTLLLATSVPAYAAGATAQQYADLAPGHINCTCRANGRSYGLGERVCLSTPGGSRMAECRMSQNVTSWVVQGEEGCVVSQLRMTRIAY